MRSARLPAVRKLPHALTINSLVCVAGALGLLSCGAGEKERETNGSAVPQANVTREIRVHAVPLAGPPPSGATIQMVSRGDSIFHGQVAGGLCYVCHGADATGTPLGPPLIDHQWITGPGSYEFIQQRVKAGMPTPTAPYLSPMPPMGGPPLSRNDLMAVAAYVYSISHSAR